MSTERPAAGDERTDSKPSETNASRWVGRRTWLKALGVYAAGRTMLGLSGYAAAAEYTTHEVEAGETLRRRLGDGDSFENVLIDVSAPDASADIVARGSDWTIRNVGIEGTYGGTQRASVFDLQVDEGGEATFENVYLGDGAGNGGYGGVFVPTEHAGRLTIRRCHVAEWPDNGVYASAPGRSEHDGKRGVVRIVDSYGYNNNTANFRVGSDGSSIERSVVHVDGDVQANADGKENVRGIWVKEGGTVDIVDCDVLVEGPDGADCIHESDNNSRGFARVADSEVEARGDAKRFTGNVETDHVGDDPDVTPPTGVPRSARDAARGGGSADGGDETTSPTNETGTRSIRIEGGNSDDGEFLRYAIEAGGDLSALGPAEDNETASGGRATGATGGSRDAFAFDGSLDSFDATLTSSNGHRRASVVIERKGEKSKIRFAGGNDEELLTYEFEVTGSIAPTSSVEERSRVSDDRARGATGGEADELVYTGDLVSLRAALPPDAGRFLVKVAPR